MNEGENSAVPQNPDFESSNTPTPEPTQAAELTAPPSTNPSVETNPTFVAQPQPGAIVSQPSAAQPPRQRFAFSNRRYNPVNQNPVNQQANPFVPGQPAIASTPAFFQQTADNVAVEPSGAKSKKKRIIFAGVAVVAVLLVVVLIAVFSKVISDSAILSKQESLARLTKFEDSCEKLTNGYSLLMEEQPTKALKKRIEKEDFFLVTTDWINTNKTNIQNYRKALADVKGKEKAFPLSDDQRENLSNAISSSESLSEKINSNIEILSDFNDVFGIPAEKLASGKIKTANCKNPAGVEKLSKYSKARDAVTFFKDGLCDVEAFVKTGQNIDRMTNFANLTNAKRQLTYSLIDVSGNDYDWVLLRRVIKQLESLDEKAK